MSAPSGPKDECSRCGYPRTRTACARCLFVEPEERDQTDKILCPRCEGQKYDVGSCGLCGTVGWLDDNGERLDHEELRADALKWRRRASEDGGGADPKAEQTLALFDDLHALRVRVQELTDERDRDYEACQSALRAREATVRRECKVEADRRVQEAERALRDNDRDARWIVGQWQRLHDEPVKEVALAIVARCGAVLGGGDGQQ